MDDDPAFECLVRLIQVVVKPADRAEVDGSRVPALAGVEKTDLVHRRTITVKVEAIPLPQRQAELLFEVESLVLLRARDQLLDVGVLAVPDAITCTWSGMKQYAISAN